MVPKSLVEIKMPMYYGSLLVHWHIFFMVLSNFTDFSQSVLVYQLDFSSIYGN